MEIKRITIKYEDEKKQQDMKQKQKKKLEQIRPPKENIVLEMSAEHDTSAYLGGDMSGMDDQFEGGTNRHTTNFQSQYRKY